MITVFTGLDGMGTSTISRKVSELDEGSILTKTPSDLFVERNMMDEHLRNFSPDAHMMYYLMSVIAESDRLKACYDVNNTNIYITRYLIDTVVSNRVAGIDIPYDYNIRLGNYVHKILVPDVTVFIDGDEAKRQQRISKRGKDCLDKVLDDPEKVKMFRRQFIELLDPKKTIWINNNSDDPDKTAKEAFQKIKRFRKENGLYHS